MHFSDWTRAGFTNCWAFSTLSEYQLKPILPEMNHLISNTIMCFFSCSLVCSIRKILPSSNNNCQVILMSRFCLLNTDWVCVDLSEITREGNVFIKNFCLPDQKEEKSELGKQTTTHKAIFFVKTFFLLFLFLPRRVLCMPRQQILF